MNIALNHPDLLGALEKLKLTCGNPQHPLLETTCVLVKTAWESIRLLATDTHQRLEIEIPATINAEGTCLLPLRRLYQAVSSLKDSVALKSTGTGIQIISGTTRLKLKEFATQHFPLAAPMTAVRGFSLPCAQLKHLLRVSFCVSIQAERPILRGASLQSVEGKLLAVATDSKRLALCEVSGPVSDLPDFSLILPQETLSTLLKILPTDDSMKIEFCGNQVRFLSFGLNYQAEVIEGSFPDWRRVFPSTTVTPAVFDRQEMLDALARVGGAHDGKSRSRVELGIKFNRIQLRLDGGEEELGEDEIVSQYEGEPQIVRFDLDYLIQGLRMAGDGTIRFYGSVDTFKPGLFQSGDYSYILAPMKEV